MADVLTRTSTTASLSPAGLAEILAALPRVPVAALPTPLEEMPRLTAALGGPRLLIKRDDLTGLALGGNKVRHLEFRIADALARGLDSLIVMNVAQSNHARIHAAAAARFGLKMYILRPGPVDAPVQGNLLLDHLFGATIIPLGNASPEECERRLDELLAELAARGERPLVYTRDPRARVMGVAAYLNAAIELLGQFDARRLRADHLFVVGGCSATGLALAGKLLGAPYRVHAVCVGERRAGMAKYMGNLAASAVELLKLPVTLDEGDFDIHDEYVGPGYGQATDAGVEAIRLAARTEGLVLDPVYTGKALSALIDQIRQGALRSGETAVFVHTGGLPITFAYSQEILARL